MNVLNPLSLLEQLERGESLPLTRSELVQSARNNAERLRLVLESLLDLASLEAGALRLRLKEANLKRLFAMRLAHQAELDLAEVGPVLIDPVKWMSAVERTIQTLKPLGGTDSKVRLKLETQGERIVVSFFAHLSEGMKASWQESWDEATARVASGMQAQGSVFRDVEGTSQEFLSRTQEGLGAELALILWMVDQHEGVAHAQVTGSELCLKFELSGVRGERDLERALNARLAHLEIGLGSVGLVLLEMRGPSASGDWKTKIKQSLFRSSDGAFETGPQTLALLLDDCRASDVPLLVKRLSREVGGELAHSFAIGPDEGLVAQDLLTAARLRLKST
jgi:hypothetical protein